MATAVTPPASAAAASAAPAFAPVGGGIAASPSLAGLGAWEWQRATDRIVWNEEHHRICGVPAGTFSGDRAELLALVHPDDRAAVAAAVEAAQRDRDEYRIVFRIRRRDDGAERWVEACGRFAHDADGAASAVGYSVDVTDRVQREQLLRQAQKLEAVGQLAGGIAHDFNNLLTVIGGSLELARGELPAAHAAHVDLEAATEAAERARSLVRRLLAFSRRQLVRPRLLSVNDVVTGAQTLLRRAIGDANALDLALAPDVGPVRADPGQLELLLLNLALNAREAMLTPLHGHPGTGGTLRVVTETVVLSAHDADGWPPLLPGRHLRLTVSDTGHGMDPATLAHVFEPFFTTKPVGAGTGLGLATVHGIVVQAGGAVRAQSARGAGTRFTILLPVVDDAAGVLPAAAPAAALHGQGMVLLVEDEAPVRATTRRMLERSGYEVVEARHGRDALALWDEHAAELAAVVTDVRMPGMGGRELASHLRACRPSLPIVFISGYADQASLTTRDARERVVEKPFTSRALVGALQEVLEA